MRLVRRLQRNGISCIPAVRGVGIGGAEGVVRDRRHAALSVIAVIRQGIGSYTQPDLPVVDVQFTGKGSAIAANRGHLVGGGTQRAVQIGVLRDGMDAMARRWKAS